jgi:hypothetical protein
MGAGMVDLASAFAARFQKMPSWLLQAHDFKNATSIFRTAVNF